MKVKKQKVKTDTKKEVYVIIGTSYLTETIQEMSSRHNGEYSPEEYLDIQKRLGGYDSNNLTGITEIETRKYIVKLQTPKHHKLASPFLAHFGVYGSTRESEEIVKNRFSESGVIIARYSVFYGKRSNYSGELPEETGYSLDIPKEVSSVKALLKHNRFLEGVVERDEKKIINSLNNLNSKIKRPILITPFLKEALKQRIKI